MPRRSRPTPVYLEVERLEDRTVPAGVVGTGTGLLGQYFSNTTLTSAALTRTDASVNFNWGTTAPAPGMPTTSWSARWTGLVQAAYSQTYTFTTISDDGVRLFVNGKELINDWTDHAARSDSATISLQAGQKYTIEMDYYQDSGQAVAQLLWSSPSTSQEVIPTSQLYVVTAAIDAGGGASGSFVADTDFSGGSTFSTTAAINTSKVSNPAPQAVYQTERFGNFTYTVPNLTPGAGYTVRLDFAELYWNAAGQRLFNVSINGQQVLTNFDIYAAAGGKDIAIAESFTATANSSGQIAITFTSVKDNAKVSGIEITPLLSTPASAPGPSIDAGGGATGSFVSDTDFSGGSTFSTTAAINTSKVSNPAPQAVYQTERFGNFTYTVPNLTPGAGYTVRLDFAELYWNAAGQRLFNVSINGQQVLTNFDIYATAGGKDIAIAESFTATANSSGKIVITFTSVKDNAKVSGIEITPLSPSVGTTPPDWFSQNLHDTNLAALARVDDADHVLSRADMLQLFAFVDRNSTISSRDLTDLRTLVANASTLGMPGYVQDLANKVLNGDPADSTYQGQPLAALTAGSSNVVMQDLVNKWFLGLDLPAVGSGVQYVLASGTLFGSGLSYTDIKQGSVSDCYFLAGLAEVAYRSPSAIQGMFIDNGDGTYTARFYNGTQPDYVTVNLELPESNGTFIYANFQGSPTDSGNKLWVALAEKAYAQLAASGWSRGAGATNSYSSLNVGWEGNAIAQITGKTATSQVLSANATTESAIASALAAGRMIGMDTNHSTATGIVPDHVYVALAFNAQTQIFTVYNPWGTVEQLSWAQIEANFDFWSEA